MFYPLKRDEGTARLYELELRRREVPTENAVAISDDRGVPVPDERLVIHAVA